jgi:hypothetical protein
VLGSGAPYPTSPGDNIPPGGGPSSVIGPACVPIHGQLNSSFPSNSNWTDGIVYSNGTWENSSCVPANGTTWKPEQVGTNEAAMVRTGSWLAVALCAMMGVMVWFG